MYLSGISKIETPRKIEFSKWRQRLNILLKKAMRGDQKAKEKLQTEYGVKIYSSKEVEEYQKRTNKKESIPKVKIGSSKRQTRRLIKNAT